MDNYEIIDTPTGVEEKKIGKIKPSKKIAQFTAQALGINFIAKEATIEGRYISGLGLEDVVFKLTICDDDTIDFEEISDTNKTDFETRKRYIEDILNSDTVPYNKLSVFPDWFFIFGGISKRGGQIGIDFSFSHSSYPVHFFNYCTHLPGGGILRPGKNTGC